MLDKKYSDSNEILTTGQVAKLCRVNPKTVKRWIDEGALKAYGLPITGFYRVRIDDFLAFIKAHQIPVPEDIRLLMRPRILIVDDEKLMVAAIRRALSYPLPDRYDFEEAADGFDAGRKIAVFKPDLIILDILMPRLDGFGVCRKIRENPDTRSSRILVISALMPNEEKQKAVQQGADDYLAKPFGDEELRQKAERLLTEGSRP